MGRDPRVAREDGELQRLLEQQLAMLTDRCESFYQGKHYEAVSAASILYTLLNDRGKDTVSLLGQLDMLSKTDFLDSRHRRHGLTLNTAKGAWPVTTWPERAWRNENRICFAKWWSDEKFHIMYNDLLFTRQELVELVRHKEGGGHVDRQTHEKIALVRRTRSPWRRKVEEHADGTATMYVGIDLSNREPSNEAGPFPISDHEFGCIIAIAEELLFSLTPEPENRKRMIPPEFQKPLYLSEIEKGNVRRILQRDLEEILNLEGRRPHRARILEQVCESYRTLLASDDIDSEQVDGTRRAAAFMLKDLDWEPTSWD